MSQDVVDNAARQRFELAVGAETVFASYRRDGARVVITHVEAPPALRGTGASGRLMEGVAGLLRARGETAVPVCSYAAAWFRRHRAYHDLLA